jgi:YebC/PmpR family DNA-binding regulatory protein
MAGHSHSANIKFRKDRVDGRRARAFSKLARMITVAAKLGGGDPDANPRLRLAIEKARVQNVPKDNIERAIKKGTGEGDTSHYEELVYEGYGPGGVGVLVDVLTDNRHRTSPEMRNIFERAGGNLAASGAVARLFQRRAVLVVDGTSGLSEDKLMEVVLQIGADDLVRHGDTFAIHAAPGEFVGVKRALEQQGVPLVDGSVTPVPDDVIEVADLDEGLKLVKLVDALEEHDDVQSVAANFRLTDEVAEQIAGDD